MSKPTVRLDITIEIRQHDADYDTEMTVEEWNALTDDERGQVYQDAWSAMAQNDNGGVHVLTEGAEGL